MTPLTYFSPPQLADLKEQQTAVYLYRLLLALLAIFSVRLVAFLLLRIPLEVVTSFFFCVGVVALLPLTQAGYTKLVGFILTLVHFLLYVTTVLEGIYPIAILSIPITIILSGTLLGRKWLIFFAVVCTALVLTFGQLGVNDHFHLSMGQILSSSLTQLAIAIALTYLYLQTMAEMVQSVREGEELLKEQNKALSEVQQTLEQKIQEGEEKVELARLEAEQAQQSIEEQVWQAAGEAQLAETLRMGATISTLANAAVKFLCQYLNAQVGAVYFKERETFKLIGSYAYIHRKQAQTNFRVGEGFVGQAVYEKQLITLNKVPADYMVINTGLVHTPPQQIIVSPFLHNEEVIGVVELGTVIPFTGRQLGFLNKAMETIGVVFHTTLSRSRIDELLSQTQKQAEELQVREEELQATNEELLTQAESLRESQVKLREQQAELEANNVDLEEKTTALQQQRTVLNQQNQELRKIQQELEKKAEELSLASKYKSEFLANMSHELRTPLNSLLILAKMLAGNDQGNLTAEQIESAQIIYNSGSDLLTLINEILDLSKVEAGKMHFHFAPMMLRNLVDTMEMQFVHVAAEKGVTFETYLAPGLPGEIFTDQVRVQQVVKNLLSNAFKFTEQGQVRLEISRPADHVNLAPLTITPEQAIAITVKDTGIGMTPDQQKVVFEAFQQADGSTSRKYGGTGLGLTISRELVTRLGGKIALESQAGEGSIFTLYLPIRREDIPAEDRTPDEPAEPLTPSLPALKRIVPTTPPPVTIPAKTGVTPAGKLLLIIEDDPAFSKILANYAHQKGFETQVAYDGETGVKLAKTIRPMAILLDLQLPNMSGWQVLEQLKQDAYTRHIPIHILSSADESIDAYKMGAMGFLTKPIGTEQLDDVFQKLEQFIARQVRTMLIVEDDAHLRHSVRQLLNGNDVQISEAKDGRTALQLLREQTFDCLILDLTLPDMSGFELLNQFDKDPDLHKCPIIIYTGKSLTEEEELQLMKYANSVIIKGAKSPERLLDETALFLHRVVANLPQEQQKTLQQLYDHTAVFKDKHILVVDDDMRNAFALSKLLGAKGMRVSIARNGKKALETLDTTADIDLVLMDIMMPEMDGYETMQHIRAQERFRTLPILALTAKAMKGDLEKCIAAGANDYLSKPVDTEKLFSMLQVWLYR